MATMADPSRTWVQGTLGQGPLDKIVVALLSVRGSSEDEVFGEGRSRGGRAVEYLVSEMMIVVTRERMCIFGLPLRFEKNEVHSCKWERGFVRWSKYKDRVRGA